MSKDAGVNLNHEVYFIIADHTIKYEVRQLLSKYKYGNDIHEHGKQQNVWTIRIGF